MMEFAAGAQRGYASTGGVVSAAPSPPRTVNPSCFGTLEAATDQARETRLRIERIVDRLAGAIPERASVEKNSEPNSLLDAATRQAADITSNMSRIHAALDRLESQLP